MPHTLLYIAVLIVLSTVSLVHSSADTTPIEFSKHKEKQIYLPNGANKHLYCSLCTRVVEELYSIVHTSNSRTSSIIHKLIDKQFRHKFIDEYSVTEIGTLKIDRRHYRKLVKPLWIVPAELLPKGGIMPGTISYSILYCIHTIKCTIQCNG